ncbi:MAG: DUF5652 family protein [Minisyncoccia bacterium]
MMNIMGNLPNWALLAVLWSLPWKGVALWKAARLSHKNWFIAILIINTLGLMEIYYIFFVAKKFTVETIEK